MEQSAYRFIGVLLFGSLLLIVGTSAGVGPTSQVEQSTTADITISINDSRHGTDTTTTQIEIQSDTSSSIPTDLQRFTGGDSTIGNLDVLAAVQAANDGTQIAGQPVGNLDVLRVVQYVNNA